MSVDERAAALRDADAAQALAGGAWDPRCQTKLLRVRQLLCALAAHVKALLQEVP